MLCLVATCVNQSSDIPDVLQLERLPYMVQGVWSEILEQQIDATTQFRKLLSIGATETRINKLWFSHLVGCSGHSRMGCCAERNPPIEEVISQGVIPRFVQFLSRQDAPQLQVSSSPRELTSNHADRVIMRCC